MKFSRSEFVNWKRKAVTLIGMSGVGKTMLARKLPSTSWFHFSADYRIGTRYVSEQMLDNIKEKAMEIDFLRDLLRSDSIYIANNITVDNLEPLSKWMGKLGNSSQGGLCLSEFKRRQQLHLEAEIASMLDVGEFIRKSYTIYGYENFVNDSSGSVCELGKDEVLRHLAEHTLIVYLEADEQLEDTVIKRQESNPKPLYYEPEFLDSKLGEYLQLHGYGSEQDIEPDDFVRWIFPHLVKNRKAKYESIADNYGYTMSASRIGDICDVQDFIELVCESLDPD